MLLCLLPCMAQKQHGKASFYSKRATGAKTASGIRVHHDSLTCAHRSYPFGTMLKVTNLKNDKSVVVKVTDRGPFGRGRIIDLSWAAAEALGMIAQGIATVKVEVVENPIPYRPSEKVELPHIDFEVAEAGYSFINKWKEPAQNEAETREMEEKNKPDMDAAPQGKHSHTKKSQHSENTPNPKTTHEKGEKATTKKNTSKKNNTEKETNKWGSVFEKIKDWGNDIF